MENQNLAENLKSYCLKHTLKLGTAESCTGGALAACITQNEGVSDYFEGSIVSYSNNVKTRILGVPSKVLEQYGAVSVPVALLMQQGALAQLGCDIAIATTGIAGPTGGTPETPVGTVFIAIGSRRYNPEVTELHLEGDRQSIIQQAVEKAISLVNGYIEKFYK